MMTGYVEGTAVCAATPLYLSSRTTSWAVFGRREATAHEQNTASTGAASLVSTPTHVVSPAMAAVAAPPSQAYRSCDCCTSTRMHMRLTEDTHASPILHELIERYLDTRASGPEIPEHCKRF